MKQLPGSISYSLSRVNSNNMLLHRHRGAPRLQSSAPRLLILFNLQPNLFSSNPKSIQILIMLSSFRYAEKILLLESSGSASCSRWRSTSLIRQIYNWLSSPKTLVSLLLSPVFSSSTDLRTSYTSSSTECRDLSNPSISSLIDIFLSKDFALCQFPPIFRWKKHFFGVRLDYSKEAYRFNVHLPFSERDTMSFWSPPWLS